MFLKTVPKFYRQMSIRLRLTLWFVTVFGMTFVFYGFLTFNFLTQALQKEFDDALYNYAIDVSESISLNPSGDIAVSNPQVDRQKIYPFSLGTALIQLRTINGKVLTQVGDFGTFQLPFKRDFMLLSKGEDPIFRTLSKLEGLPSKEANSYRVVNFAIDNSPVPQLVLQIAVPLIFLESQIERRRVFLLISIPLILLLATLGGYFLSTRAMTPVSQMIDKAHEIGAQKLSERLPVPEARDELSLLAETLNQMLERIERAFLSQERFVADASHQLLTPLSIMKGEIENQIRSKPSALSNSILQEVDQLIALVKNMLLLARVDAGLSALTFSNVGFEDIVLESIARAEKLALKKNIKIQFNISSERGESSERPLIRADEDLLFYAVFNLLENAIKYSPAHSMIVVTLLWKTASQLLTVRDAGPGIREDQLDVIFGRFSRGSGSTVSVPGYGLGLAIGKKIAELHGAHLWAENNNSVTPGNSSTSGASFHFEIKNI